MSVVAETSGPANVEGLRHLRELYFELGKALSRYGRHAEATQAFEQALKEEGPIPDRDVVMFSLGVAYEHAGEPDRAFQNYLQAIAVAPQRMAEVMPCVHKLLTHDLAGKEGEWLDSQWKPKIKTADLPPGLRGDLARFLGRVSLYRSEYTRAEELFRQALAVSPDDPRVLEGLGESLWHNSNISEALEFLTRAHEIAAHGAHRERLMAIDAKLAEVLVSAGQYEAALDRIAESLAEGDRFATELLLSRSQCYLALAQPEKALEAAEAAQQREPASVEARVIRSQALIALGRGSDAVNVIDEALQYDPQRQDLLLYKAQALVEGQIDVRQGRRLLAHYAERAGAEIITPNTLPAALRARSADGNAQYFLAELYRALGYPDEALRSVDQALEIGLGGKTKDPGAPAEQLKGELLEKRQPEQAANCFYEAGRRFLWRGEFDMAVEQLQRSADLNPNRAATYWYWARALTRISYQTSLRHEEQQAAIKESVRVWDKSTELAFPGRDTSWAYIYRAWISERRASLQATNLQQKRKWHWEAIAFLERALLLYEPDADAWASLGRYHRYLRNDANALQATARAWELDKENPDVQWERAAALANAGELDDAEVAIDRCRAAGPDTWADYLKAYILAEKRQYEAALDLLNRVVQAAPEDLSILDLRARCFRVWGEKARAEEDYKTVWSRYDPRSLENQSIFGMAAYHLGQIEQALAIFRGYETDDDSNANWYLGACYLAQNNLADGERYLARSVALADNIAQLDDMLGEDLPDLEASCQGWPHQPQVHEILTTIRQQIASRRVDLQAPRAPENELQESLAGLAASGEPGDWPWIAIHAGLGRLYTKAKRYDAAATIYRKLSKYHDTFPEFGIATQQVAAGFEAEGEGLLKSDDPASAIEQFRKGLNILSDETPEEKKRRANLQIKLGLAFFLGSDPDNARSEFRQALELHHQLGTDGPGQALGEVCRKFLSDPRQYWALEDEWRNFAREAKEDTLKRDLAEAGRLATKSVLDWLERRPVDADSQEIPIVTPIVMEIGSGLIPADTSENWSLFKNLIPDMRSRFENQMGLQLPGIRVRGNANLTGDAYTLLFDEHRVAGGSTHLQMRYCPAGPGVLQGLGIPGPALVSVPDPLTAQPGFWVPQEYWEVIGRHNVELWAEPLAFVVYHLEAVLRRNLADFLGVQEVENLLENWGKSEGGSALIEEALPDATARVRFARLLRALVREQVPITAWRAIVVSARASGLENFENAVRAVRLRLSEQLPGNGPSTWHFELPPEWGRALDSCLRHNDAGSLFAPPSEQVLHFLLGLGDLLGPYEANAALVVDSPDVRPHVRRLVESRFPQLAVLSREEAIPRSQSATSAM